MLPCLFLFCFVYFLLLFYVLKNDEHRVLVVGLLFEGVD